MSILVSIVGAILTYLILYKIMFQDKADFYSKLRSTVFFFPLGMATDAVSDKESLRIWLWLLSGVIVAIPIYKLLI